MKFIIVGIITIAREMIMTIVMIMKTVLVIISSNKNNFNNINNINDGANIEIIRTTDHLNCENGNKSYARKLLRTSAQSQILRFFF